MPYIPMVIYSFFHCKHPFVLIADKFVEESWKYPDNKVHGANMGPRWGRQDPGGPHVGPMNFAIWVGSCGVICVIKLTGEY